MFYFYFLYERGICFDGDVIFCIGILDVGLGVEWVNFDLVDYWVFFGFGIYEFFDLWYECD